MSFIPLFDPFYVKNNNAMHVPKSDYLTKCDQIDNK